MEPAFTYPKELKDEDYINLLFDKIQNANEIQTATENFWKSPVEDKINHIYILRISKISRIFRSASGSNVEFKAQKETHLKNNVGVRKRTVQSKNAKIRFWEYWTNAHPQIYLMHFTNYTPNKTKSEQREHENQIVAQEPQKLNGWTDEMIIGDQPPSQDPDFTVNLSVEELFGQSFVKYDAITNTVNFDCNVNVVAPYQYSNQAGADYAEWVRRHDPSEIMQPGDVVGVISGNQGITKTILPSYVVSVISTRHALCANLPPPNIRPQGEPVAFKGQAPVKIIGKVKLNDIIVPSGKNDGTGIAKRYCKDPDLVNHVVGQAWEESNDEGVKLVNCMIDIKSPDIGAKSETTIAKEHSELQELMMYTLANKDNESSFLDVHLADPTAVFAELKNIIKRLLEDMSGLTVIVWVDKSAVPGFIKTQFLRDFGVPDALSGGVAITDKESLVLVEEWNREVSYPKYDPTDFDQRVKTVDGVSQNLLATYELAKLDRPDNHTVIISIDIPTHDVLDVKRAVKNASLVSLIMRYPITRGFRTNQRVQLYQLNLDSLPPIDKLHVARQELWAKSAIPHENIPKGITSGRLNSANAWELKPFSLPQLKEHVFVEHLECKALALRDAISIGQGTAILILGGFTSNNEFNEHIYKVVQDSSGHVHSFIQIKLNAFRPDSLLFKLSPREVAILHCTEDVIEFSVLRPEESLSTKKIGTISIEGTPKSVCQHYQSYFICAQSKRTLNVYQLSFDLTSCKLKASLKDVDVHFVDFVPTSTLHMQVNSNLYLIDSSFKQKAAVQNVVDAAGTTVLHIKVVNNKMTLLQTDTVSYAETILGELLEVLPRANFSCTKVNENKYSLFGGVSPTDEVLSDVFTFVVQPPDPLKHYTNIWAAKFKIFSQEKKARIVKYEQDAVKACEQNNYIKAVKLYEGLSMACPSFEYYLKLAEALTRSKTSVEISHFQAKIEVALQLASEYIQSYDDKVKVDEAKSRLVSKLPRLSAESANNDLTSSFKTLTISTPSKETSSLQERFEAALKKLDQTEAIKCIIEGVKIDERYKVLLNNSNATLFVQHLTEKCCANSKSEQWAIWLVNSYSHVVKNSSLLRLAIPENQRKLVDRLLELNLTQDINFQNAITRDDYEIAELAAKKDFPSVIKFCYKTNTLSPVHKVVSAACTFASEDAFNMLLELKVPIDGMSAIQKCITNMSKSDALKRMRMISKIIERKESLQADQILCWVLKRHNLDWFNQIVDILRQHSLLELALKTSQPLLIVFEDLHSWDIDDIEPILQVIAREEHFRQQVKVRDTIFTNCNEHDDEDVIVETFRVIQDLFPNIDLTDQVDPNILEYLVKQDLIDDNHIEIFFKFLVEIGFSDWKMTDSKRREILARMVRIANTATQDIVKKTFSCLPPKFLGLLLLDLLNLAENLSAESVKLAEVIRNHGKIHQIEDADKKLLLQLAQRKKISSLVDVLSK